MLRARPPRSSRAAHPAVLLGIACVDQDETARAVGGLGLAGREAALSEERRLLVSGYARDGHFCAEKRGVSDDTARVDHPRQELRSTRKSERSSSSQSSRSRSKSSVRDAFVTSVTCAAPPVSFQTSQESIVPNARSLLRLLRSSQDPLELRGREVRVGHEPCSLANQLARQLSTAVGGAPVLPDDRVLQRAPRRPLPDDGRLPLIRDADRPQLARWDARLRERVTGRREQALRDLLGIVLDPARLREVLADLAIATADRPKLVVDDEARRACRPLVDGQQHVRSMPDFGKAEVQDSSARRRPRSAPRGLPSRGRPPWAEWETAGAMRRTVAPIYALFLLETLVWIAIIPLAPTFADEFALSGVETGMILASSSLAALVVALPLGVLADRFGARRVTIASACLFTLATLGQGLADEFPTLLASRLAFGVAFGALWGPAPRGFRTRSRRSAARARSRSPPRLRGSDSRSGLRSPACSPIATRRERRSSCSRSPPPR